MTRRRRKGELHRILVRETAPGKWEATTKVYVRVTSQDPSAAVRVARLLGEEAVRHMKECEEEIRKAADEAEAKQATLPGTEPQRGGGA